MSLCTSDADKIDEEIPENPDDEDEDEEDVDFNPFLKDALSPEPASSSISSDIEGQDGNFTKPSFEDHTIADPNDGEEEVVMQAEGDEREAKNSLSSEKFRKRKCYDDDDGGDEDSDSAISKRTRAKYSLASFTLDELETFLQETDDEDDFYNVDDEEEYRKFLSAVLLGGDGDGDQSGQENGESNAAEEDDEDNDADFEIELEELLESDVEDDVGNSKERKRPETRQSRRPKALKKKGAGQVNRPLRPILPIFPSGVVACFANVGGRHLSNSESCAEKDGLINGVFSSQQIGQLYCLMHEHVQLLIQVFSLSILDPNRQDIASQLHGLIFEMLHKRNDVVASRSAPYPDGCFNSSYMCPSVQDDVPDSYHPKTGSLWTPTVTGPIVTILDVPTLSLVDRYMEDVQNASQEYRHRFMSFNCDSRPEKEPLFHISYSPSIVEANGENSNNCNPHVANIRSPTSGKTTARKPLATAMVESAKRDSVALVPKDISKLAQRFFPVFNPALFPHKPPCTAVTNRILFTESEDELLALGMMEYNTDWKAIQQRFLPCKSKHQIFVRQKNRCSSKAPENPIKAVRRMKTAPLNADELERIKEGMRIFKSDWMSIWKFIVPHKDPSLLPRQFRIALGTQRSYKQDDSVKEKRRLLQLVRKQKAAELTNCTLASDKEDNHTEGTSGRKSSSRDDHVNNANEMYVHQAFLSDWRPGASSIISRVLPCSNFRQKELPSSTVPAKVIQTREQPSIASTHASYFHSTSFLTHPPFSNPMQQNYHGSASNKFNPQIHLLPYRTSGPRMVKLAPGLPPVNLPSSARVISQSELKSSHCGVSLKISAKGGGSSDAGKQNMVPSLSHAASSSAATNSVKNRTKSTQVIDGDSQSHPEEPTAVRDTHLVEERSTDADLQMHPLLFQPPGDGRLPYFPLACRTGTPSAFTLFSGNQPQLNLSLFHKPHQNNLSVDNSSKSSKSREFSSAACNIDFHPLLQRTDVGDTELVTPCTSTQQKASLRANSGQFHNQFDSVQIKSLVNSSSFDASPKHSITNEKINELDLEIHLSSTSMTVATKGSRAVGTNNQPASAISASHVGNITETREISRDQVLSDIETSVVPGNNVSKCNVDVVGDLSQPGIVMEQEELSDSDEDVEENLEFECEEMADSDGEGHSDSDLAAEGREEEIPNHATEKVSNKSKFGDQSCELSSPDHPQGNNSIISKSPPSLKLSLTSIGKDTASRSWLSLDSCAPVGSSTLNDKRQESIIISESPCVKKLSSSRPVRSCKKMTPSTKVLAAEKDVVDMAQQLSLGPLAVSTFRKPRMRASRTNTSLTMESTKNARHDQGDFG